MLDLINRAELPTVRLEIPKRLDDETCEIISSVVEAIQEAIRSAPTVEAEPVRHGEWRPSSLDPYDPFFICTVCKYGVNTIFHEGNAMLFCPSCGAKMDEEAET